MRSTLLILSLLLSSILCNAQKLNLFGYLSDSLNTNKIALRFPIDSTSLITPTGDCLCPGGTTYTSIYHAMPLDYIYRALVYYTIGYVYVFEFKYKSDAIEKKKKIEAIIKGDRTYHIDSIRVDSVPTVTYNSLW